MYIRILLFHQPLHIICFLPSYSRQTNINWFHENSSQLGQPQGPREQYPKGVQQDFTLSSNIIYLMPSFSRQTNINWFHVCPSQLGYPHGLQQQHPDGVCTAGFYFPINPYMLGIYVLSLDIN